MPGDEFVWVLLMLTAMSTSSFQEQKKKKKPGAVSEITPTLTHPPTTTETP